MTAATACPPDLALRAFALGKLDDALAEGLARHLERCPSCLAKVDRGGEDSFVARLNAVQRDKTPLPPRTLTQAPFAPARTVTEIRLDPPAPEHLAPELTGLVDYTVTRKLGEGGMGAVYLARNVHAGRDYVLKVIRRQFLAEPGLEERFLQEIRAAVALGHHPNIVTACPPISHAGSLIHVMEFVDGQDLAKVVAEQGALPVAHACSYVGQAAKGLQHALDKGLIHRDVKPHNLMLTREGGKRVVKVADFGLAKRLGGKSDAGLTGTGASMGTPDYIAPEQALDAARADARSDVYSLGCTLYCLLAGRPPFSGGTGMEKMIRHVQEQPAPIRSIRPDVPEELAAALARMMAKDPARRFPTPGAVVAAVAPFTRKPAGSAVAVGLPPAGPEDEGSVVIPELLSLRARRRAAAATRRLRWTTAAIVGGVVVVGLIAACAAGGLAGKVRSPQRASEATPPAPETRPANSTAPPSSGTRALRVPTRRSSTRRPGEREQHAEPGATPVRPVVQRPQHSGLAALGRGRMEGPERCPGRPQHEEPRGSHAGLVRPVARLVPPEARNPSQPRGKYVGRVRPV